MKDEEKRATQRRSTRVNQQLVEAKERAADAYQDQQRRWYATTGGAEQFFDAAETISDLHGKADRAIERLQERIRQIQAETQQQLQPQYARQADAAYAIRTDGELGPDQVAEVLRLSKREANRLIRHGRQRAQQPSDPAGTTTAEPGADTLPDWARDDADEQADQSLPAEAADSDGAEQDGDTVRTGPAEMQRQDPDRAAPVSDPP